MIHAKYQPVTVSWDGNYIENQNLDDRCQLNAFFAFSWAPLAIWDWWNAGRIYCLYGRDHWTFDSNAEAEYGDYWRPGWVEGRDTLVQIPMMMLATYTSPLNACSELITSSEEVGQVPEVLVYPNPAVDQLYIQVEDANYDRVEVYNQQGQRMVSQRGTDGILMLEVGGWPSGMYWLRLADDSGRSVVRSSVRP
jgi:hypothetical protein